MSRKCLLLSVFLSGFAVMAFYANSFEDGEKLYLDRKVKEALPLLEQALAEEPGNELVYIYLAHCYESQNEFQKSLDILRKGLRVARDLKYGMYYFMGNAYYIMENYKLSAEMFSQSLALKSDFDKAVLNRAQAQLQLAEYKAALSDYRRYLELAPQSQQRKEVEEIIRLLSQELSNEERMQMEKEAREKQLKDLLKTLEDAEDTSKNLKAGAEKLEEVYIEGDIVQ